MIKITNDTLIIEIPCKSHLKPLQVLAQLQEGLINMLHTMSYAVDDAPKQGMGYGVQQTTMLLREMMISSDQFADINEGFTAKQTQEFNRA